ncbi:TlpA family protein disulfide reductase [Sphingobacterium siyangense]|uniref:TlpA family protein disulfide reductase n=1 Tax=Sphingobacterium siyangense TaxID=459529 RepID=UPI002FDD1EF5
MKHTIKICALLFRAMLQFFTLSAVAVPLKDSVHIKGRLLQEFPAGSIVKFQVVQNYASPLWTGFSKNYEALIDSTGSFEISFLPKDDIFYCKYLIQNSKKNPVQFSNVQGANPVFLMQSGDDFSMEIGMENISFKGKGAAKMNCQYLLNINPIYPRYVSKAIMDLTGTKQYEKELDYWQEAVEDNLRINLGIIEAYSSQLTDSVKRILRYDYTGRAYKAIYGRFQKASSFGYDFDFYKRKLQAVKLRIPDTNDDLAAFSWGYMDYLYEKEKTKAMFAYGEGAVKYDYSYAVLFDQIMKRSAGMIRDNLLVTSFLNSLNRQKDSPLFEREIKKAIDHKKVKIVFDDWLRRNGNRSPAFAFALPDTLDVMHKLADYKGKVLIVDFWFNGCFGCAGLNKSISPVIQKYKDNPKVQFLSISVGASRKGWIDGIRTGMYTHPEQVMLSTHGRSTFDTEIVKFYNYNSFPRLLLIDKQGKNVMSNAPNPRLDGGAGLIAKIEELL